MTGHRGWHGRRHGFRVSVPAGYGEGQIRTRLVLLRMCIRDGLRMMPTMRPDGSARLAPPASNPLDCESATAAARRRLRHTGAVPIEPDPTVAALLGPGERVLARRHGVAVLRPTANRPLHDGSRVDLYLTDGRLILVGPEDVDVEIALDAIREADVVDGRLLLLFEAAEPLALAVSEPCVLRVEVGAARVARRRRRRRTAQQHAL